MKNSWLDGILARVRDDWRSFRPWTLPSAWALALLLLTPLKDSSPGSAQISYDHAEQVFQRGNLARSQHEAELGAWRFQVSNPEWAAKFQLLQAETMVRRGMYDNALQLLSGFSPPFDDADQNLRKLAIESDALTHQRQFSAATIRLNQAENFCMRANSASCGYVLRTRGLLAVRQGEPLSARQYFSESLFFARTHHDQWAEVGALNNLGFAAMHLSRFDEAVDWLRSAHQASVELGSDYWTQLVEGNLGWAYYQLGDNERALEQFLDAEKSAARLGNIHNELNWITTAGHVYRDTGDLTRATQSYRQALDLAKKIDSKEDITNALEDLARVSVETGKLDEASAYLDQVTRLESAGGNRPSAYVTLTQGMLAAARRQDKQAEVLFRAVQNDPASPTTRRFIASDELARLFERQGKTRDAEQIYRSTLDSFESARAQLRNEDSRLPFAAHATEIYDDYIHLLVHEGKSEEALAAADQSRARTLAQGLGVVESKASFRPAALNPRQIAQKTGATLLFYWLGTEQSYLWAITPAKITLVQLPPQKEIVARVERYRKTLLDVEDPLQARNEDGKALYQLLVAPAAKLIRRDAPVMILADGALSKLNFETLLAPGANKEAGQSAGSAAELHYLLDDATLLSAPSLAMLAAAKPARNADRRLLLLGDAVSPSQDYPSLPLFGVEMSQIEKHFPAQHLSAFAGPQATPSTYLASNPAQYSYIHFVAHAVASRTDPLDSAIILSRAKAGEDSFKLYARDIMQHPIDARLVTISACYGSGTRSYAGEGLVGLSWAFLRAGAHSVIGALWEVSDDSTPRLMDSLYQGVEHGQDPAVALRRAKLGLLHSQSKFRRPFYWAPFQIYTRR
jgi:CHAT domain-containing protein/predicted negative regulator of RcsB-dependent stress response